MNSNNQSIQEYWPVTAELMAQYNDGSHSKRDRYGDLYWWQNDKLHRDGDKPAVIDADGHLVWFQNGQLHREGDKPAKIFADGSLEWWKNDQLHRIGGPAIIRSNGTCRWYWLDEELPVNSQDDFVKYLTKHKST